jgi:hypothetical protein
MWSTIAASGAGHDDHSARLACEPRHDLGQAELIGRANLERDDTTRDRDRPALAKCIDAEARESPDRVREVDLAVAGEFRQPLAGGQHLTQHALGVRRRKGLVRFVDRLEISLQPDERLCRDLQVKVRPAPLDDSMQRPL